MRGNYFALYSLKSNRPVDVVAVGVGYLPRQRGDGIWYQLRRETLITSYSFQWPENNHRSNNCPSYLKTGACQFGEGCLYLHIRPSISRTLILYHMYQHPLDSHGDPITDPNKIQEHFEDFYEDIFEELIEFGEIECLTVCDNLATHLAGNAYVMFKEEHQAAAALEAFRCRAYCGNPILVDFSPVTDFRAASCYKNEYNNCPRGKYYCNYMHVKQVGRSLRRKLFGKESCRNVNRSVVAPYYRTRSEGRGRDSFDYYGNGRQSADRHGGCNDGRERSSLESPRRSTSPVWERSVERRARIEQWNRERGL